METKLLPSLSAAIKATGLRDGMTISFHHHLRNGDYILNLVLEEAARMGIRDLTVNASSLFDIHMPIVGHIRNGVVTRLLTDYVSGGIGRYISEGILSTPVEFRSHGTRATDIASGRTPIDIAFVAAPANWAMPPAAAWGTPSPTPPTPNKSSSSQTPSCPIPCRTGPSQKTW